MNDTNDSDTVRDTLIDLEPYADSELDEAMRELLAIEAAERDATVIRQLHRRTLRLCTLAAWLTAGLVMLTASAAAADEPAKVKRPVVCTAGTPVTGAGFSGYLCTNGKKPRLFTRHIVVSFVDSEGNPQTYVLGWTGAPAKKVPPTKPAGMVKL